MNFPRNSVEAHPQPLSKVLCLEEVEENVHRWRMAKVVAENGKGLHKGPAFGVQLGRGHVHLSQERALKTRKW